MDLHISSRLKALLPSLTDEEKQQLKKNIEADGQITDPILYWHDGKKNIVVDGMNRFEIARRNGVTYDTKEIKCGDTYEDAELWILSHQLGCRNLLSPAAIRKIRGDLYNRMKRQDGGHGDQNRTPGAEYQNDTPPPTTAEKIAEKAGVSPSTVKRDGARAASLDSLSKPAKKIAEKATDKEVKALAKLDAGQQAEVARAVRVGQAGSVTEALKMTGVKPPQKKKAPPKKLDRGAWLKQWESSIGPLVRLVDKIAGGVGEKRCESHKTVLDHLNVASEEMHEWMGQ